MTDAHEPVLVAETIEAFRGKIYMLVDNRRVPLRLSRSTDKFSWGFAPQDDWLQAGGQADSPVFHFTFLSQTENRHHFSIRGTGHHADKKLGISLNGYLGLYKHAEVTDFWKLETLNWTEQGLHCRWRDHQGQQVKAIMDTPHHEPGIYYLLNVQEGEVHEFLIERVD